MYLESIAIPAEEAVVRHYFMEFLNEPEVIWTIRVICLVTALGTAAIYAYMKKRAA